MVSSKRAVAPVVIINPVLYPFSQIEQKQVIDADGRRSYQVKVVQKPFVERGFKVSDFSVSSILASGANSLLSPQLPLSLGIEYLESMVNSTETTD